MLTLPPYVHPEGRSSEPCGNCGALASEQPIYEVTYRWTSKSRSLWKPAPTIWPHQEYRCMSCWVKGESLVGDLTYEQESWISMEEFNAGGDFIPDEDQFEPGKLILSPDKTHVAVIKFIKKVFVPDPPSWLPDPRESCRYHSDSEFIPETFEEKLEHKLERYLLDAGMPPEPLNSKGYLIPKVLLKQLSQDARKTVRSLSMGKVPERGLFLAGGVGGGKTSALAVWIIMFHANLGRVMANEHDLGWWETGLEVTERKKLLTWIDWPQEYAVWNESGNGYALQQRIAWLGTRCKLLVLDDIGSEFPYKVFGVDNAGMALQRIIDLRDSHKLPTFFTSNLENQKALHTMYGPRIARRIERLNDCFYFKDLPFMK